MLPASSDLSIIYRIMKEYFLKFVSSIFLICGLLSAEAQNVKIKTIKYGGDASYTGEVVKKSPMGKGELSLRSYSSSNGSTEYKNYTLTGTFNGTSVTDAEMNFEKEGIVFKGDVSYRIENSMFCKEFHFTLKNGKFYQPQYTKKPFGTIRENGIALQINSGIGAYIHCDGEIESCHDFGEEYIAQISKFAKSETYECKGFPIRFICNNEYCITQPIPEVTPKVVFTYDNGATITLTPTSQEWQHPDGDYISIKRDTVAKKDIVVKYRITLDEGYIDNNKLYHKFSNGNTYFGTVAKALFRHGTDSMTEYRCTDRSELLNMSAPDWDWKDILKYAKEGVLTYSDGECYDGVLKNGDETTVDGDKLPESAYFNGTLYNADKSKIQTFIEGMNESQYSEHQQRIKAEYDKEKATDYFKFDNYGNISEFKITYPNLAKFIYRYDEKNNKVLENTIYYPNGDVLDNPYLCKHYNRQSFDEYQMKFTNDQYQNVIPKDNCPSILDTDIIGKRIFKDGFSVALMHDGSHTGYDKPTLYFYTKQKKENGDYALIYTGSSANVEEFKKTFNDYKAFCKDVVYEHYWEDREANHRRYDTELYYKNGNIFKGTGTVYFNSKIDTTLYSDSRVIALGVPKMRTYESIEKVTPYDGRTTSPSGKILEIYRDGEKLDDFNFAQVIASEEGKLRLEQEKLERQKQGLLEAESKYGKKNVDALMRGKIIIGMPVDLLIGGVNYHILPYLSISLSIDQGNSKCYDLWKVGSDGNLFDPDYAGYVWVTDGKVSSIHL